MAINIGVNSNAGINVNSGSSSFLKTLPTMFDTSTGNFGYFYNNLNAATAYGLALEEEGSIYTGGPALLARGLLRYDLNQHVVTGRLDSVAFGEELNGISGGFGTTSTKISLGSTDVTFADLGLDEADGDDVNGILYGLMTGDATKFLKYLSTSAVSFTGGDGNDTYVAGNKADVLNGGRGNDHLSGGGAADTLNGSVGNDVLIGGSGNDKLTGGKGADTLTGGGGKDQFIFTAISQSSRTSFDTITDFTSDDRIDLHSIDANSKAGKDQAFKFIGTHEFSHTAGELRYERSSGGTDIYGDTDGNGKVDFAIHLSDSLKLHASDFLL